MPVVSGRAGTRCALDRARHRRPSGRASAEPRSQPARARRPSWLAAVLAPPPRTSRARAATDLSNGDRTGRPTGSGVAVRGPALTWLNGTCPRRSLPSGRQAPRSMSMAPMSGLPGAGVVGRCRTAMKASKQRERCCRPAWSGIQTGGRRIRNPPDPIRADDDRSGPLSGTGIRTCGDRIVSVLPAQGGIGGRPIRSGRPQGCRPLSAPSAAVPLSGGGPHGSPRPEKPRAGGNGRKRPSRGGRSRTERPRPAGFPRPKCCRRWPGSRR